MIAKKTSNSIAYKKTNMINPQINQAPGNIRPLVIKESVFQNNASMMAAIEQQKSEALKRQKQQKIRNFQENIKFNASKISSQKSIMMINSKKQKQDAYQKQKQIKLQYTRIYSKNKQQDSIRHVKAKPQYIEIQQNQEEYPPNLIKRNPSVKIVRERSKSPLSPLGIDKSQITIPKYIEQNYSSSSSDYQDSENQGENIQQVMKNYLKIRTKMNTKFQ